MSLQPGQKRMLRRVGMSLASVGTVLLIAAIALFVAAIWNHGHDLTTRLTGSGGLALFVGAGLVIVGSGVYMDNR